MSIEDVGSATSRFKRRRSDMLEEDVFDADGNLDMMIAHESERERREVLLLIKAMGSIVNQFARHLRDQEERNALMDEAANKAAGAWSMRNLFATMAGIILILGQCIVFYLWSHITAAQNDQESRITKIEMKLEKR